MNEITKFIWYRSDENYVEIDNEKKMKVDMKKKYMKYWAEKLGVEFIDKRKEIKDLYKNVSGYYD